ncbi:MAG: hypothetical protein ABSE62_09855 [Chthoniobacteraceae bacterium]
MKTALAILLSFIICEAPVLADHGYTLGGEQSAVGTYAGALIPIQDVVLTSGTSATSDFGSNSLGLFTLNVVQTGLGTGTVALFSGDQEMNGTIQATQNPETATQIIGVMTATGQVTSATFNGGLFFGNETLTQLTGNAGGSLIANVVAGGVNSPTGTNLTGTSQLTVTAAQTGTDGNTVLIPTDNITYAVDGFQQSTTPNAGTGSAL